MIVDPNQFVDETDAGPATWLTLSYCPIFIPFSSSQKMIGLHTDTHLIVLVFSQLATMGEKVTMRGSFARKVFLFRL